MGRPRKKVTREMWDRLHRERMTPQGCIRELGASRALLYRAAKEEGWPVPAVDPRMVTPQEQVLVLERLKIRTEFLSRNRHETDQQVLRIIAKLRCHVESWIEHITRNG